MIKSICMRNFLITGLAFAIVIFTGIIPRLIARINGKPVRIKTKTLTVTAYIPYGKKRKNLNKGETG